MAGDSRGSFVADYCIDVNLNNTYYDRRLCSRKDLLSHPASTHTQRNKLGSCQNMVIRGRWGGSTTRILLFRPVSWYSRVCSSYMLVLWQSLDSDLSCNDAIEADKTSEMGCGNRKVNWNRTIPSEMAGKQHTVDNGSSEWCLKLVSNWADRRSDIHDIGDGNNRKV